MTTPAPSRRRWFRFSLRAFFVVLTIFGVWLGVQVDRATKQKRTVDAIKNAGGYFRYDDEYDYDPRRGGLVNRPGGGPRGPAWLRNLIGRDYLANVIYVWVRGPSSAECIDHLEDFPRLKVLMLSSAKISDASFEQIGRLTNLEALHVDMRNVNDADLGHLERLTKLHELSFCDTNKITDAGLVHLKGMNNLENLFLGGNVAGPGLEQLKDMKQLNSLLVNGLTDAGIERLRDFPRLKLLFLGRTEITSSGVEHLMTLPRLDRLLLIDVTISDDDFDHLKGLNLTELGKEKGCAYDADASFQISGRCLRER